MSLSEIESDISGETIEKCKKVLDCEIESFITPPLNSAERAKVHEYCKNLGLLTKTLKIHGLIEKKIQIFKFDPNSEAVQSFEITHEMVDFFSRYSLVPLPTNNPQNVLYYVDEMKDYYSCHLWDIFLEEVKATGFSKMRDECNKIKSGIIGEINKNVDYIEFCNSEIPMPKSIINKSSIYNHTHSGKYFVSIDIKSANFTNLKKYCPSIPRQWKAFVGRFSGSKFLAESKHLREIIFGELKNKKLFSTIWLMMHDVDNLLATVQELYQQLKKVMCTMDEIIYEVDKDFDITPIQNLVLTIDPSREIYRIEKFKLVQLSPHQYFVKELSDGQIQFKSIPKYLIMQCIKYYNKKSLTEYDKKFSFEDFEATFSDLLIFD